MMTPKEKAEDIFNKYFPHAYPFSSGSGFLSGDLDPEAQKTHAKELCVLCVQEIITGITLSNGGSINAAHPSVYEYWDKVLTEIKSL